MPRLFSAIEIPSSIAERLTLLRAGLSGARWIDPENYHLTLRFIGDVDGHTARDFTTALGDIVAAPFELRLNGLGSFGGGKPRAIFADIAPSEGLEALRRANERAAREAGLPPEGRNFKPHVTLARLRGARPDAVAPYLERQGGIGPEPFTVSRFVLYSSRNSVGGGPYVVEAAYPLEDLGASFRRRRVVGEELGEQAARGLLDQIERMIEAFAAAEEGIGHVCACPSCGAKSRNGGSCAARRLRRELRSARRSSNRPWPGSRSKRAIVRGRHLPRALARDVDATVLRRGLRAGVGRLADMPIAEAGRVDLEAIGDALVPRRRGGTRPRPWASGRYCRDRRTGDGALPCGGHGMRPEAVQGREPSCVGLA